MKKSLVLAVLASLIIGVTATDALAQGTRGVAIIDLSYIFKNHLRFKQMKEGLRGKVEAAEASLKSKRDAITAIRDRAQKSGFKPDSPEFKQMEVDVTTKSAQLQADVALRKKEFLEQEAKMYFNVYQEIIDEVSLFARQNGYSLVLRFNGEPIDRSAINPQEVLRGLNRAVVYHDRAIDITPYILKRLNERVADNTRPKPPIHIPRR